MWKHSTHLLLTQILVILGGCVALEIGSGQAIEKEETSSFMAEFGGVKQGGFSAEIQKMQTKVKQEIFGALCTMFGCNTFLYDL
jgi:hypothetical protein